MIAALAVICIKSFAQVSASQGLYAQTSEMANTMIQYDADRGSILRFYGSSAEDWWMRQGNDYNSPERRNRLLELIADYQKQIAKLPFEKMNVNGKVDYILFKRNLEDEQYQLQKEQKLYEQVNKYLPFSDSIYALQKPRRRGLDVNGATVARTLNNDNKEITHSNEALQKSDSIEIKQAGMASDAVKGLRGALKNYYDYL